MLRLIHTADWHLGHQLHGFDRGAEHEQALASILDVAEARRAHAVLIAGDVFHHANPPLEAIRRFFHFIHALRGRLPQAHLVAIAGNHDSGARLELPLALGADPRLTLIGAPPRRAGRPDPCAALVPLLGEGGELAAALLALPYPRPGDLSDLAQANDETDAAPDDGAPDHTAKGHAAPDDTAKEGAERAAEGGAPSVDRPARRYLAEGAAAAAARWPGLPLIVAAHAHVAGGLASQESERRIVIGGEEAIPLSDFPPGAAYVALGHLHRPQKLSGEPLARYAGAPLPLALDERRYRHSVAVVTLSAQAAAPEIELAPLPRPRAILRLPERGAQTPEQAEAALAALGETLRADAAAAAAPPYLELALRLERPEPDLRRRLEEALGDAPARIARIRRIAGPDQDGPAAEAEAGSAPPSALTPPSPATAFEALHVARFGAPPEPALREAFDKLAQAVANEDDAALADRGAPDGRSAARG